MIAISTMVFSDLDVVTAIERIARLTKYIRVIEISHAQLDKISIADFKNSLPRIIEFVNSFDVSISIAHAPTVLSCISNDEASLDKTIKILTEWMEVFERIGIEKIVVHTFYPIPSFDSKTYEWIRLQALINKRMFSLLDRVARDLGVFIYVENRVEKWIYGNLPKDLLELVEDLERTGICFDTGHANANGYNLLEYYSRISHRVGVYHIHDNNGRQDMHLPPFMGTIDWDSFMSYIDRSNDIVLEVSCNSSCKGIVRVLEMFALKYDLI